MKTKIAGVALAAVIACGWAGYAQATTIINLTGVFEGNDEFTASINVYGNDYDSYNFEDTTNIVGHPEGRQSTSYSNVNGHVSISASSYYSTGNTTDPFIPQWESFLFLLRFDTLKPISDQNRTKTNLTQSDIDNQFVYVEFDTFYPDGFFPIYTFSGTVTSLSIAQTPLPNSAPLFGIAVMSLVGLSYATRRVSTNRRGSAKAA